jgi:phosphatidylserine decarboxylase
MPLRIARYGVVDCIVTALLLFGVAFLVAWGGPQVGPAWLAWAAVFPAFLACFAVSFYRDPERTIPQDAGLLVSPADGVVTDMTTVDEKDYLGGKALRIGIFLSPLNVHVNRSPVAGTIEKNYRKDGKCLPATGSRCIDENASNLIGIKTEDGTRLAIRQVTGALARRIVCPLTIGQVVGRGERVGMIKLGSRTELLVPVDVAFEPLVKVGDPVRGGSSILGRLTPKPGAAIAAAKSQEVRS